MNSIFWVQRYENVWSLCDLLCIIFNLSCEDAQDNDDWSFHGKWVLSVRISVATVCVNVPECGQCLCVCVATVSLSVCLSECGQCVRCVCISVRISRILPLTRDRWSLWWTASRARSFDSEYGDALSFFSVLLSFVLFYFVWFIILYRYFIDRSGTDLILTFYRLQAILYATSVCRPLLFWFSCKWQYINVHFKNAWSLINARVLRHMF